MLARAAFADIVGILGMSSTASFPMYDEAVAARLDCWLGRLVSWFDFSTDDSRLDFEVEGKVEETQSSITRFLKITLRRCISFCSFDEECQVQAFS